ncbi:MAG: outer membrane lipoprotein-sorting protein [Spirochaetia bacterium]
MKRLLIMITLLMVSAFTVTADIDPDTILSQIDELQNFDDADFSAIYTIVSERPGEERSVTEARLFRRDRTEQFLLLIIRPEVDRGQGYLQIDENVWFYDPDSREFERTSIRENVEDSDAQNEDFNTTTLAEDYQVVSWEEGTLGSRDVYILDLEATNTDVAYENTRLFVLPDPYIILKEEDYSVSGRLMRSIYFYRYANVGDRFTPNQVLIVDELNEGERTQLTVRDITTQEIPDRVFTRDYLERVNR